MSYNQFLSLVILVLRLSLIWLVGVPSSWCLYPFGVPSSFEHFLIFWHQKKKKKCSKCILYFPRPRPGHLEFLQGVMIPFSGEEYLEIKIWVQCMLILFGMSLLGWTELYNIYILYIYSIYICKIYVCVSMYMSALTSTHLLYLFLSISVYIANHELGLPASIAGGMGWIPGQGN